MKGKFRNKSIRYQKKFPLYDKFLPILAKYLPLEGTIIDIGANIGTTTLGMRKECYNPIIAIENDPKALKYLAQNLTETDNVTIIPDSILYCLDKLRNMQNIVLYKSDIDGYDWVVLKGIDLSDEPIIFFENEVRNYSKELFYEGYKRLDKYSFYVFDNYGNLMLEDVKIEHLDQLNRWVLNSKKIYYTDILAVTKKHQQIVEKAITEFKEL